MTEIVRNQLLAKLILKSKINEQRNLVSFTIFNKLSCVIFESLSFRIAKEEFKGFYSPTLRFCRISHRCESWDRFVVSCLESWNEGSMTSHTEPCDWNVLFAHREIKRDKFRELFSNIREHSEILFGCLWSSINIVTCWLSELPITVNVWNACLSRTCIRENASNTMLSSIGTETRLECKILVITT